MTKKSNEKTQNPQTATKEETTPIFSINRLYIRDLSIEMPNAPFIFLEQQAPTINIELQIQRKSIDEGIYEVVLTITVTAKLPEDKTAFLVEVAQAGLFEIRHLSNEDIEGLCMVACPNILFPYAREAISSAITRTGYPPVMLTPMNFEAMYHEQKQQATEQESNNSTVQ